MASPTGSKAMGLIQPTTKQLRALSDEAASLYDLLKENTDRQMFTVDINEENIRQRLGISHEQLRGLTSELEDAKLIMVARSYSLPGNPD